MLLGFLITLHAYIIVLHSTAGARTVALTPMAASVATPVVCWTAGSVAQRTPHPVPRTAMDFTAQHPSLPQRCSMLAAFHCIPICSALLNKATFLQRVKAGTVNFILKEENAASSDSIFIHPDVKLTACILSVPLLVPLFQQTLFLIKSLVP